MCVFRLHDICIGVTIRRSVSVIPARYYILTAPHPGTRKHRLNTGVGATPDPQSPPLPPRPAQQSAINAVSN